MFLLLGCITQEHFRGKWANQYPIWFIQVVKAWFCHYLSPAYFYYIYITSHFQYMASKKKAQWKIPVPLEKLKWNKWNTWHKTVSLHMQSSHTHIHISCCILVTRKSFILSFIIILIFKIFNIFPQIFSISVSILIIY